MKPIFILLTMISKIRIYGNIDYVDINYGDIDYDSTSSGLVVL